MDDHRPPVQPMVTHSCPKCGAAVRCDIERGLNTCWCFHEKRQDNEVNWNGRCNCKACLTGEK